MPDCPRLLLAAPASGGGKTTLVSGLLRALLNRGLKPAAFKCGPDYIDPLFHRAVLGVEGYNLDLFFSPPALLRGLLRRGAKGADISLLEGVMGYYDGLGESDRASSWRIAVETATPAVLAVNAGKASLSPAALIKGFADFRPNSMLRGVILNRCSESWYRKIAPVLTRETGIRVYGHLPELPDIDFPSRHLGLTMPGEIEGFREKIRLLAARLEATVDIPGLMELARSAPPLTDAPPVVEPASPEPVSIAVARDAAFCFYYRENLELLEELGGKIRFFSPLADAALPDAVDGIYLGGGYPELYAEALAANASLRHDLRGRIAGGTPVLAEGGGFLYLGSELRDAGGRAHAMVNALSGSGSGPQRTGRFGYVALRAQCGNLLCARGEEIRGHETHYWESTECGDAFLAVKPDGIRTWPCIHAGKTLAAGFPHLYFWSNPSFAASFIRACAAGRTPCP